MDGRADCRGPLAADAGLSRDLARRLAGRRAPRSAEQEIEPLYGKTYLPRKFKVGIGLPGDNCADVYCQDVGLLAVCRNYDVIGYNVLVGGGMGMTPAMPNTFPALAQRMAYARADRVLDLLRAIFASFATSAIAAIASGRG